MQITQQPTLADASQESDKALICNNDSFARSIMTLLGGNVVAQLIPYLATIILAHLFSPAAFGYLALFTSVASTFAILATGRYELAVLLPAKEKDATALVFFAVFLALCVSTILAIILLFFLYSSFFTYHPHSIELFFPLAVFAIAVYQVLIQWFLRRGHYRTISSARFIQAAITVVIACALGWFGYQFGLIVGYVLGWIVGAFFLIVYGTCTGLLIQIPTKIELIKNAIYYSDHAIFGTIPALLDALSLVALMYIINQHYGSEFAGQYNVSLKFVYGPISLIAGAIAQVIFRESSQRIAQEKSVQSLFKKVTRYLTYSALFYSGILIIFSPKLFNICLGSAWDISGQITVILAIAYGVRLIVSTLSVFLLAHNALRINGLWQGSYFMVIGLLYFFNPKNPLVFFLGLTFIDVLMFGFYFLLIKRVVRTSFQATSAIE